VALFVKIKLKKGKMRVGCAIMCLSIGKANMLTMQQQVDYLMSEEEGPPTLMLASMIAIHFQLQCLSGKVPLYTSVIEFLSEHSNVFATPKGRDALIKMAREMLAYLEDQNKMQKLGSEMAWMKRDLFKGFFKAIVIVASESFEYKENRVTIDWENLEAMLSRA